MKFLRQGRRRLILWKLRSIAIQRMTSIGCVFARNVILNAIGVTKGERLDGKHVM